MEIKYLVLLGVALILASGCVQQEVQTCNGMTLEEAKEIAVQSECGDNLKDAAFCNEVTGTWWIDLDIEKELCNPACVVNVESKHAEINWRCTGLIE